MQFTLTILTAAIATLVSSAAIKKRDSLPTEFTLESSTSGLDGLIYSMLMYANSSAYIGNIKYQTYSEPLTFFSGGDGASFTSFHSSPTGSQRVYVFPNESMPIGFTVPHSARVPAGAVTTGFGEDDDLFTAGDQEGLWKACPVEEAVVQGTWQIYYDGAGTLDECGVHAEVEGGDEEIELIVAGVTDAVL